MKTILFDKIYLICQVFAPWKIGYGSPHHDSANLIEQGSGEFFVKNIHVNPKGVLTILNNIKATSQEYYDKSFYSSVCSLWV